MKDNVFMLLYLLIRRLVIYHFFSKALHFKRIRRALKFILGLVSILILGLVLVLMLLLSLFMVVFIFIPAAIEKFLEDKGLKTPGFFTKFATRMVDFIMPINKAQN